MLEFEVFFLTQETALLSLAVVQDNVVIFQFF